MNSGSGQSRLKRHHLAASLAGGVLVVLLAIFGAVYSWRPTGQRAPSSQATAPDAGLARREMLLISITKGRQLYLEEELLSDMARFYERVKQELRSRHIRRVLLRADPSLPCGLVRNVLEAAFASGAKSVAIPLPGMEFGDKLPELSPDPQRGPNWDLLVVGITPEGGLTINGHPNIDEVHANHMRRIMASRPADYKDVYFQPHERAPYARLLFAISVAHKVGAGPLPLAARPYKKR
jgi:biopolymer transport protein ExbD